MWTSAELGEPSAWTWKLTEAEIDELVFAAEPWAERSVAELGRLQARHFPLATVGPRLLALRHTLVHGRGFALATGLRTRELGEALSAAVFFGIGAHLGSARSQNRAGDLVGHVRNVGLDANDPDVRIYQTDRRQTFHTDSTDVVGLLCLETAASGGDSLLVSAGAVYNEMVKTAPDLAIRLFDEVATDRRGEVPDGVEPFFRIPVLSWYGGHLTVMYQRQYIESADRFDDAPRRSPELDAALDLFDKIANRPDMHLRMSLAVGDMQFVHNHSLLHDRTGFVDRPGSPRHLMRLWLSIPGDRELPPAFASRYGSITVGDRGGIVAE